MWWTGERSGPGNLLRGLRTWFCSSLTLFTNLDKSIYPSRPQFQWSVNNLDHCFLNITSCRMGVPGSTLSPKKSGSESVFLKLSRWFFLYRSRFDNNLPGWPLKPLDYFCVVMWLYHNWFISFGWMEFVFKYLLLSAMLLWAFFLCTCVPEQETL